MAKKKPKVHTGYVITQKVGKEFIFFIGQRTYKTKKTGEKKLKQIKKQNPEEQFKLKKVRFTISRKKL